MGGHWAQITCTVYNIHDKANISTPGTVVRKLTSFTTSTHFIRVYRLISFVDQQQIIDR